MVENGAKRLWNGYIPEKLTILKVEKLEKSLIFHEWDVPQSK